jgi:hypothetical protein
MIYFYRKGIYKRDDEMVANTARLKTRKQVSTTVDISLWEELQALSKNTRVPVSKYLDEAIVDLLKKYQK